MKGLAIAAGFALAIGSWGCAYMGALARQSRYAAQTKNAPSQRVYKHMLDRPTFFVFGRIQGSATPVGEEMAVVAVSDLPRADEVVDVSQRVRRGSYYGLNLPAGRFRLLLVGDADADGFYTGAEVIGERVLVLDEASAPGKVKGEMDIGADEKASTGAVFRIAVEKTPGLASSVFYPPGTIRPLDDPVFSREMASLGLYQPAAFLENAPMMFYALEDDHGYKVPVIFVHGIDGSARDFVDIVQRLDHRRYRAWFFHYPSGAGLSQLGEMFYEIFLSGKTIPRQEVPCVIVAHSMGGLIVRDALSRCDGTEKEAFVRSVITIASPFGGHPGAARAARAPVVIPSWRDLDPDSTFIRGLHRRPLPTEVDYHLFYTFRDPRSVKFGENSDGVVPLASQLAEPAQKEAREQFGLNASHDGVLHDPVAVARLVETIEKVKSTVPEDHLREFDRGGYRVTTADGFSPLEAYLVSNYGRYLEALVAGVIEPFHPEQVKFVEACRGERKPDTPAAEAWLKFKRLFPDRSRL